MSFVHEHTSNIDERTVMIIIYPTPADNLHYVVIQWHPLNGLHCRPIGLHNARQAFTSSRGGGISIASLKLVAAQSTGVVIHLLFVSHNIDVHSVFYKPAVPSQHTPDEAFPLAQAMDLEELGWVVSDGYS